MTYALDPAEAWAELETPLDEAALFFVEQRDKEPLSEIQRVTMFRQLMRMAAPAVAIVGIPNAAKRGQWAINQARKEGAAWGFPDVMVLAKGRALGPMLPSLPLADFLEFKSGTGKPAAHQIAWLNRLHRMGFPCGVFRRPETAVAFLRWAGFPFMDGDR